VRTFLRAAADQLRMQALSPLAILATLAMPCVFAFVVHSDMTTSRASGGLPGDIAVGSAGIGMLDSIIVLVVFSLLGEKRWKTLYAALGSPGGLVPVVIGRLTGIVVQSLTALPGTIVVLALLWGINGSFPWGRWLVGGLLLAPATGAVVGLLAVAVLRFPYSAGMTNGLVALVIALSALIVPQSALPGPVQKIALLLPQAHIMYWVRGGPASAIAVAVLLTLGYGALVVLLVRRVENTARRQALPLEA
jgi:hypothetical protein